MNFRQELESIGKRSKNAFRNIAITPSGKKKEYLLAITEALIEDRNEIFTANRKDVAAAKANQLRSSLIDRLALNEDRMEAMIRGIVDVANLPDPVGELENELRLENGLRIRKVKVPIGVIGIIYESRPNVTVDAAILCLMAGNAVILRGGSESIHSNRALASSMARGLEVAGCDPHAISLIPWTDRKAVAAMITLNDYLHLIIPRGGEALIRYVTEHATVPVIKHYKGVCHIYVDKGADMDMALAIIENAKCQRPGVCNAVETVLIHRDIAEVFAPKMADLLVEHQVELRADAPFCSLVPTAKPATEEDWYEEYLDLILSVRIVADCSAAIKHIATYGSDHSDAIISNDQEASDKFLLEVDSAVVYVNASTRFTDGSQFGLGAEIGISTDRLHARGPMGLRELTTYKYVVLGDGQIR